MAHRYLVNGNIGHIDKVTSFHYNSPEDKNPVPDSDPPAELDWDLWLGPLRWRPYNKKYCHGVFRWIMESGGGQIRDRGAHVMSCAMWWMGADGTGPVTVEATGTAPTKGLWDSAVTMDVTYTFKNPDWVLTWNQHTGNAVPAEKRTGKEPGGKSADLVTVRSITAAVASLCTGVVTVVRGSRKRPVNGNHRPVPRMCIRVRVTKKTGLRASRPAPRRL